VTALIEPVSQSPYPVPVPFCGLAKTETDKEVSTMSRKSKPPPLPILAWTHRPQHRQHRQPVQTKEQHDAIVKYNRTHDPDFYKLPDYDMPYGVWICDDENRTEVLFDYGYHPIWKRSGKGGKAVRAKPHAYVDWIGCYWLWDRCEIPPWKNDYLHEQLLLITEIFREGGPLLVRRWKPEPPRRTSPYVGEMVARSSIPASAVVVPFRRRDPE
jgi:hypothetical protein